VFSVVFGVGIIPFFGVFALYNRFVVDLRGFWGICGIFGEFARFWCVLRCFSGILECFGVF